MDNWERLYNGTAWTLDKAYRGTKWSLNKLWKATEWTGRKIGRQIEKIPKRSKGKAIALTLGAALAYGAYNHYVATRGIDKSMCEETCEEPRAGLEGAISGQEIVDYAKRYVGIPYGLDAESCRPKDAKLGICSMQCASFVGSVFKYAAIEKGITIAPINGNGINKCDCKCALRRNKFDSIDSLRPGDIFSSTSSSEFGHAGIYAGKGWVSQPDKSGKVYLKFTPDRKGKRVFIHMTFPVAGYSTLEQITGGDREILSFCRHDALCNENDEVCK